MLPVTLRGSEPSHTRSILRHIADNNQTEPPSQTSDTTAMTSRRNNLSRPSIAPTAPSNKLIDSPSEHPIPPLDASTELLAIVATAAAITHQASSTPGELIAFAHAALYSPPISTLEIAMKRGYLPPFVGLSTITLKKYPPTLEATTMGHGPHGQP
jgi:hypothetical protein